MTAAAQLQRLTEKGVTVLWPALRVIHGVQLPARLNSHPSWCQSVHRRHTFLLTSLRRTRPMQLIESFREQLAQTIETQDLSFFQELINDWREKIETTENDLAAALLYLAQKDQPLNVASQFPEIREPHARGERDDRNRRDRNDRFERGDRGERPERGPRQRREMKGDYQTYRIEVGKEHGVRAGDIVGAIANEANIDSQFIGNIKLFDHFSTVELPAAIPNEIFQHLKKVYVRKQKLNISIDTGAAPAGDRRPSNGPSPRPGAAPRAPRKPRD